MNLKKQIFIILLLVASIILTVWGRDKMFSIKSSFDLSRLIRNENIDDLSLSIYYMSPFIFTDVPLSVDDLINESSTTKTVISGSDLEEHINLFNQICNYNLIPVKKKSSKLNVRMYYVLESRKSGKLLEVAMWGSNGADNSILVNGIEVKEKDIFYDVIIPFLTEEAAKEWATFVNNGEAAKEWATFVNNGEVKEDSSP